MTRTSLTWELWLVLKCYLMGFCNLMYYKSNANFHRFIFRLCIYHLHGLGTTPKSSNILSLEIGKYFLHLLLTCDTCIDYANRIDLSCTKCPMLVTTKSSCIFLLKLFPKYNTHSRWVNFYPTKPWNFTIVLDIFTIVLGIEASH